MTDESTLKPPVTVPWSVIVVLIAAFVLLMPFVRGGNDPTWDDNLSRNLQEWDVPLAETLATVGNTLGESKYALALFACLWVLLPLMKQRRRELVFVSIAAVLRLAATLLKDQFDSPRPSPSFGVVAREHFDGSGFPSGHVVTSAVMLGTIWFLVNREIPNRDARLAVLVLWIAGVGLTAFARIWVGAHWASDTIGGALVGVTIILVAANLSALISPDRTSEPEAPPARTPGS